MEQKYERIGEEMLGRLKYNLKTRIDQLKRATMRNNGFLNEMIAHLNINFESLEMMNEKLLYERNYFIYNKNTKELREFLKQIVNDWSSRLNSANINCYKLILNDMKMYLTQEVYHREMLIFSSGAGRLFYEAAKSGYQVTVLEPSFLKLTFYNFLFQLKGNDKLFELQPFINSFSNILFEKIPFEKFSIPDESPSLLSSNALKFLHIENIVGYEEFGKYDIIITYFFIDKTVNVLETVAHLYKLLRPGGLWVNYGPMIFENPLNFETVPKVEVSWENLKFFIESLSFKIIKEDLHTCPFNDYESMNSVVYKVIYTLCTKI